MIRDGLLKEKPKNWRWETFTVIWAVASLFGGIQWVSPATEANIGLFALSQSVSGLLCSSISLRRKSTKKGVYSSLCFWSLASAFAVATQAPAILLCSQIALWTYLFLGVLKPRHYTYRFLSQAAVVSGIEFALLWLSTFLHVSPVQSSLVPLSLFLLIFTNVGSKADGGLQPRSETPYYPLVS